jgi:hypothetical protein
VSVIEDLTSYSKNLEHQNGKFRQKIKENRHENKSLKNENAALKEQIAFLEITAPQQNNLNESLGSKRSITEKQELSSSLKRQKRELKLLREVSLFRNHKVNAHSIEGEKVRRRNNNSTTR